MMSSNSTAYKNTIMVKYIIQFLSDWHVGSGLSAGAQSDAEVLKDEKGLPYIPGKTIKGLLKDALFEMPENQADRKIINKLFGYEVKDATGKVIRTEAGALRFSNACLPEAEQSEIIPELAEHLYHYYTSTTITEKGVAKPRSLRTMEVCMPLILEGNISCFKEGKIRELVSEEKELLIKAFKWTRRLGVNRNRGLGRCQFNINE